MDYFTVIILGIVEGLTEFLPVSSTAHLILTAQLLGVNPESEFFKSFNIIIQIAPIFAVFFIYLKDLVSNLDLIFKLIVAFIPVGFFGLFFGDYIQMLFTSDISIIAMFVTGGLFIASDILFKEKNLKIKKSKDIGYKEALIVGFSQVLALIPGISRSGITILGGLGAGISKELAVKFSFLLALPTMASASGYTLLKEFDTLTLENFELIGIGFLVSFVFGWIAVRTFLKIVSKFGFMPFGVYLFITAFLFMLLV